jgi:curved DNA-binding protein CbpA
MDETAAAALLGVAPGAGRRTVERAFRSRARDTHPDRFPPGSEAWEDASDRMRALVEARQLLVAPAPPASARTGAEPGWAWHADAPTPRADASRFPSARDLDRRIRAWGLAWGGFLVTAAVVSLLVGATQRTNDALPIWSPALALTGAVAIAIGLRAHQRLIRR